MSMQLTDEEVDVIRNLRRRGHVVVTFNPHELRDADAGLVEDRLVELGWDIIDSLATFRQED